MTDEFLKRRAKPGRHSAEPDTEFRAEDPAQVMVVHGRDSAARDDLFNLLRALGLRPIGWPEAVKATGKGAPFNGEAVEAAFRIAQAAVVLFTPDEQVLLRRELRDSKNPVEAEWAWQARPNVFYEGGIAFTSHPHAHDRQQRWPHAG